MTPRSFILLCAAGVLVLASTDGLAQKKKTTTKPATTQTTAQVAPAPSKSWSTMRDFLSKYKGEITTLGVLQQVEADYFSVNDDGTEILYPLTAIRDIRVLKVEMTDDQDEEPHPKLSIRLH